MELTHLIDEFSGELAAISAWWLKNSVDSVNGGFYGAIDNKNRVTPNASKGVIQNARILWYFSEAAHYTGDPNEREMAQRAYQYFKNHFVDKDHGGVIWELDYLGNPSNTRKQIYAQAFAIYALSAYFQLTKDKESRDIALAIFDYIEHHGYDPKDFGYLEAFDRYWQPIDDFRLSAKDINCQKTMNTHLHIMEAYTALYFAKPNIKIKNALNNLIDLFFNHFIKPDHHLGCFFDNQWNDLSHSQSYGHDIEFSWLLCKAAEAVNCADVKDRCYKLAISITNNCIDQGTSDHGGLIDGFDFKTNSPLPEFVWWVQAEALVGYLNAYSITGHQAHLNAFIRTWAFIKQHHIDKHYGEWRWLSSLDSSTRFDDHKCGFWKGPYHNGRSMIEVCRRLTKGHI